MKRFRQLNTEKRNVVFTKDDSPKRLSNPKLSCIKRIYKNITKQTQQAAIIYLFMYLCMYVCIYYDND